MHPVFKFKGEGTMTGDPVLDSLVEVFPQVNFSTLIEVSISFKGDIDAAADYVIHNVLPNIIPDDNTANTNENLYIHGHQHVSDDTNAHLVIAPVVNDTLSESIQLDGANKYLAENEDSRPVGDQFMQSPAAASTSGQACLPEESNSESFLAGAQNSLVDDEVIYLGNQHNVLHFSDHLIGGHGDEEMQCSPSEKNPGKSAFEDNLTLHDDGSPDMCIRSNYSVSLESLDNAIAAENYKKNTLLSNVAAISEMLEEVELKEAEIKHVVSEASQAGNDNLVKAEKLKEMSTLAAEEKNKVAGEVFAEKYILASEAQGLQSRLFNISEERNYFVSIIDEMHQTLQRRLALAEAERATAETEKIERETMAQEMLKEQEALLDAAKEESKKLEQQAQENAKLRELLMDKGHAVDALHGEMLGIFDNIAQLQYRADMQLPVDEPRQLASSSMSSSVESSAYKLPVDEPVQLASSSLLSSIKSAPSKLIPVDEPLQLASPSSSEISAASDSRFSSFKQYTTFNGDEDIADASSPVMSPASENSWSSLKRSTGLNGDEDIADASPHGNFDLDDSWDVVEDEQCLC